MNIESLLEKSNLFAILVIKSGFKRDMTDYLQSIQQSQNQNLVYMKELSQKIKTSFSNFENNSLNSDLQKLLKETTPFTEKNTIELLDEIDDNAEITASEYYQKFYSILSSLVSSIDENDSEIKNLVITLVKYSKSNVADLNDEGNSLISIIFKDIQTTSTLKDFIKSLNKWNRALLIYHTLLKSDPPKDIDLVEIQNGSIDVVCNLDFNISIDLTKIFLTGLKVYGAYLLYKSKTAKEIIASYMGNKKLISMEKDREKLMLSNIQSAIKEEILEQHKANLKSDKKINTDGIEKKIDEVSKVVTEHIVKGNEIKLLTYGPVEENSDEEQDVEQLADNLRESTSVVRERFNQLDSEDKQLLIDTYAIKDEEVNDEK